MTKTFTPNDVIRFIYGEIFSGCERQAMLDVIHSNNELSDLYYEMILLKDSLNLLKREPSKNSVDSILKFSKSDHLHVLAE